MYGQTEEDENCGLEGRIEHYKDEWATRPHGEVVPKRPKLS